MEAAKHREGDDLPLDRALRGDRGVLVEPLVGARGVVVADLLGDDELKVPAVEHEKVIEVFTTQRTQTKKGAPESVDSDNLGVGRNRYAVCAIGLVARLWRGAGSAWPPVALVGLGPIGGIAGCSGAAGGAAPIHDGGAATPTQDGGSVTGAQDAGRGMQEGGAASEAGPSLTPGVAPGGNFDLSLWELQLPIGSPGAPTIIPPSQLVGAGGFHDAYFYTDTTDGSMTFWDPQNGVTTMGSMYPRSELRETTAAGAEASWSPTGTKIGRAHV
jgi:hypothetical protein